MELSGKVKLVLDLQTFDSGFQKREFVVTTQEQYPQDIKFETVQDKVTVLDSVNAGDAVTVSFDIRGNEYNGRYFVNLRAWKVTGAGAPAAPQGMPGTPPPPADMPADVGSDDDDLPF